MTITAWIMVAEEEEEPGEIRTALQGQEGINIENCRSNK
jgi:hypothetical protein